MSDLQRVTVPAFQGLKAAGRKISMLTAYDYATATLVDRAGVDGILVGDSLAMVVQGHETTLPVTLEQMAYHAEIVGRAVRRALVVVDLPFPINHRAPDRLLDDAARLLKQTRCQAVKLEGGADQADTIEALTVAGIPVMGHVGLRPQSVHRMGGYRIQRERQRLLDDARAAQQAGAFALVLECIPAAVAAELTAELSIPTIGIGAGSGCDGQVLVVNDLLGLTLGRVPRFVKQYADLQKVVEDAVSRYCLEVQTGVFPSPEQSFQ